jgi:hypothetical protein
LWTGLEVAAEAEMADDAEAVLQEDVFDKLFVVGIFRVVDVDLEHVDHFFHPAGCEVWDLRKRPGHGQDIVAGALVHRRGGLSDGQGDSYYILVGWDVS